MPEVRVARTVADLGAGVGFPGLALAVALPSAQVDLVESGGRKCETIRRLVAGTGLSNTRAVHARTEDWAREKGAGRYEIVTARALASLPVLCEYAAPLLADGGVVVCWKGARCADEERAGAAAAAGLGLRGRDPLQVEPFPGAHSRHLHVFEKVAPTPPRFPRRAGVATKRPLGM